MNKNKKLVVGCSGDAGSQKSITDGQMREFWRLVGIGAIDRIVLGWVLKNHSEIREAEGDEWWRKYVAKEQSILTKFFGKNFDLPLFEEVLQKIGVEQTTRWKHRGFEIHFLPDVSMSQDKEYPGWKEKPEDWYYHQVAEGKIFRQDSGNQLNPVKQVKLNGEVVLVDIRSKPGYSGGKQMFFQDTLVGGVILNLREKNKIAKCECGDQTSRFDVSAIEWQEHIKLALAEDLVIRTEKQILGYGTKNILGAFLIGSTVAVLIMVALRMSTTTRPVFAAAVERFVPW